MEPNRLIVVLSSILFAALVGCSDTPENDPGNGGGMTGAGGTGGMTGTGGMSGTGGTSVAAFDCDSCEGPPVESKRCGDGDTDFRVFASCRIAIPGPSLTLQIVITPTPPDCPVGGDGTKDLVVASQCDLVVEHMDGTETTVDWASFLSGGGGDCFQNTDCPGHGVERYGANWVDVPELSAPPFNGMNGQCEDVVRVALSCDGTAYDCDYTTPSRPLCEP